MSFNDKTLECVQCGQSFTFTANEQEFFSSKGFTNDPKRCPACRQSRKQGSSGDSSGYGGGRQQRKMYPAVCATCGQETEVPFEPRNGRPVYCSNCYSKSNR